MNILNGNRFFGSEVAEQFVLHFQNMLGSSREVDIIQDPEHLFTRKISDVDANYMVRAVTDAEIKQAMFDIDDDKAPGPDGYSSKFFKASWEVVGKDVCRSVRDYFSNGKLLKEINATVIALVPKVTAPQKVSDFRPIACCNVIYKCISKVITNRMKGVLNDIVDENQSAFIPGRQISDNILLSQELMRNYHLKKGPAKCAFKIDIQKAYDTVEWAFLRSCLKHFGFHNKMIEWIMNCVESSYFTINVHGDHVGYFKGGRGLRQGDPMSPYLFTMVMEVLTLIIKRQIHGDEEFQYHWRCEELELTHLCFVDDLLLFCHGDMYSAAVLRAALDEFRNVSGLEVNMNKSTTFFGNVKSSTQAHISEVMPFNVGTLPVRYLGVPLLSTRLYQKDCLSLIDKVKKRVMDWKNKSLSFAGRLQLIASVLSSLQVLWSSVFILPKAVSDDIERIIRGFLWCQGEYKRGKAKVRWNEVCKPKKQGGLGFKDLYTWNVALMAKHVWNVASDKQSVWVRWIKAVKLKDRNFWDYKIPDSACWSWRIILKCRDVLRDYIVFRLGNGNKTSAWYDLWHPMGRLSKFINYRDVYEADFTKSAKVLEIGVNGEWNIPDEWGSRFSAIFSYPPPVLIRDRDDCMMWRTRNQKSVHFSVKNVWNDISAALEEKKWARLVWFSQCIPRHAFIVWVAMHGKLKTQDKYIHGDDYTDLKCPFCNT